MFSLVLKVSEQKWSKEMAFGALSSNPSEYMSNVCEVASSTKPGAEDEGELNWAGSW